MILNPGAKLGTTDPSGYAVVPSYQPNFRSTVCNAVTPPYSSADTTFPIATPLPPIGYVS